MPVTTSAAAFHITPVVIKTFFKHARRKTHKLANWSNDREATDDIFYDEGLHIVKAFLDMATHNTVESLQTFANTHIPSPPWAAVSPVRIPLSCCNLAADTLIDWFGPEDIKTVVGGERWWQVRGMDGIDGEWITERGYLSSSKTPSGSKLSATDLDILRMSDLEAVMFYVHGGGYYFGSINTHRYQILRYARKFKGRAFAVNYRKAPQYPFPCAIQDVLAAYLYLIDPPKDALHKPIPASKIVFAGDSAGGGLCINVLTIIRDMDLPMPAGAVLISPWVDLTHSFPSVMQNVDTDIIPPHGFMAKPSALWPVEPLADRVAPTNTNPPPEPGHTDTLEPNEERLEHQEQARRSGVEEDATPHESVETQAEMQQPPDGHEEQNDYRELTGTQEPTIPDIAVNGWPISPSGTGAKSDTDGPARRVSDHGITSSEPDDMDRVSIWEPKPPKVLMEDPQATPLELRSQIQLYATNEQLTHPACSPILQGSLGNLCPLYIIAGNAEALRDEIIYLAHRCAAPDRYQPRTGVMKNSRRQQENAEKWTTPTKVHLQVFDDMCHVLTVFLYTDPAKYAYRSIAQFIMHVTSHSDDHLARNPFPELHFPRAPIPPEDGAVTDDQDDNTGAAFTQLRPGIPNTGASQASDIMRYRSNENVTVEETKKDSSATETVPEALAVDENPSNSQDIPNVLFIRERVDICGRVRPMEPAEDMKILQMPPSQIGIIKEAPVRRWMDGQHAWDKMFHNAAVKVQEQRQKNEAKAAKMIQDARDKGLLLSEEAETTLSRLPSAASHVTDATVISTAEIQGDRRWGPLDLTEERVPPSAICKRTDTPEALALLKKSIFYTAPVTHRTIPRRKFGAQIRAALDPHDRVAHPPKQSASEEQQSTRPMHGLQMWSGIVNYFMKQSTMKMEKEKKRMSRAALHKTPRTGNHVPRGSGNERRLSGRNP